MTHSIGLLVHRLGMGHTVEGRASRPALHQPAWIDSPNHQAVAALARALSNGRCRGLSLALFEDNREQATLVDSARRALHFALSFRAFRPTV